MDDEFLARRRELFPTDPRYQPRGFGSPAWDRRNRTFGPSDHQEIGSTSLTAAGVDFDANTNHGIIQPKLPETATGESLDNVA